MLNPLLEEERETREGWREREREKWGRKKGDRRGWGGGGTWPE